MGAHAAPKGRAGRPHRAELAQDRSRRARQKGSLAARVFVFYWVFYVVIIIESGMSNHLTIGFYLYSLLFWIMLPVAGISAIVLAEHLAATSASEPPRLAYLMLTFCYLSPAAITGVAAIRLAGQRPSWWPNRPFEQAVTTLFVLGLLWTAMLTLLAIGRAALNGRLRERCWLCPPRWMTGPRLPRAA
jgi:hypothetical protein